MRYILKPITILAIMAMAAALWTVDVSANNDHRSASKTVALSVGGKQLSGFTRSFFKAFDEAGASRPAASVVRRVFEQIDANDDGSISNGEAGKTFNAMKSNIPSPRAAGQCPNLNPECHLVESAPLCGYICRGNDSSDARVRVETP
jgi:hypothetical protein